MFTQKMADENKEIKEMAAELLPVVWNYESEFALPDRETGAYIRQAIETVAGQIQPEFPDVPLKRIQGQVNTVLMTKRGEGVRRREAKQ